MDAFASAEERSRIAGMIGKTERERFIIEQTIFVGLLCICGIAAIIIGLMNPGDKRRIYAFLAGGFLLFRGAAQAIRAMRELTPEGGWISKFRASRRTTTAVPSFGACPMCGTSIVIPGTCAECGERVVSTAAPTTDSPPESN